MSTTFTLTPTTLVNYPQAEGETDVVFRVIANYVAADGEYTASCFITTDIIYTQGAPFTPYADLTQEQVVGWVTSGAGAQVGTLTNAPAAGNPTTWIKIVDNGTTRYIPAW